MFRIAVFGAAISSPPSRSEDCAGILTVSWEPPRSHENSVMYSCRPDVSVGVSVPKSLRFALYSVSYKKIRCIPEVGRCIETLPGGRAELSHPPLDVGICYGVQRIRETPSNSSLKLVDPIASWSRNDLRHSTPR